MKTFIFAIYLVLIISLSSAYFSCTGQVTESQTATLIVLIVDNDTQETPIPDIEVMIIPGDITKKTDSKGISRFELKAGDYYLDAQVCCVGPGYIQYHEAVTLSAKETKTIKLHGCLACV